jgi:hypothetical protein
LPDNSTAAGIATDTVKQKRSKAIDMRFYWIRDRVRQGQFLVYWSKGKGNLADYFSKHHPASHHTAVRSTYLEGPENLLLGVFPYFYTVSDWSRNICLSHLSHFGQSM